METIEKRLVAAKEWIRESGIDPWPVGEKDSRVIVLALNVMCKFLVPMSVARELAIARQGVTAEQIAKQEQELEAWLRALGHEPEFLNRTCLDKYPALDRFRIARIVLRLRREAAAIAEAADPILAAVSLLSDDELRTILWLDRYSDGVSERTLGIS
jgi:hypothetical protein